MRGFGVMLNWKKWDVSLYALVLQQIADWRRPGVSTGSFWHFHSEAQGQNIGLKGYLSVSQKVCLALRYFIPRKSWALRHAVTLYWQIVSHHFWSRGHAFPASPLIPSVSENCFTKAEHALAHSERQADRRMLPAALSSSSVCQCSRGEQCDVL